MPKMKADVLKILAFIGCFIVDHLRGETVNLLRLCGNSEARIVKKGEVVTVKINGKDWYSGEMSCEVVLQSYNFTESLTYSFNEFYIGPYERGTTITMEFISSHGSTKTEYSKTSSFKPQIGRKYAGEPELKIKVTRSSEFDTDIRASIDVAFKDDDYLIRPDRTRLTPGQIAGIVIGITVVIAVSIIVVVCVILRSKRRSAGQPHVTHQAVPHA